MLRWATLSAASSKEGKKNVFLKDVASLERVGIRQKNSILLCAPFI